MTRRTYSEMMKLKTYEERLEYLQDIKPVGEETFGFDRVLNQALYQRSPEWKKVRQEVIIRDQGCDLAVEGEDIHDMIIVHHMNPITEEDIIQHNPAIFDPEELVCTSPRTHRKIHYGDAEKDVRSLQTLERSPGDTKLW